MTDAGEYTDKDFQEIWEQMSAAEEHADNFEARLDKFHEKLDSILEQVRSTSNQAERETSTSTPASKESAK